MVWADDVDEVLSKLGERVDGVKYKAATVKVELTVCEVDEFGEADFVGFHDNPFRMKSDDCIIEYCVIIGKWLVGL